LCVREEICAKSQAIPLHALVNRHNRWLWHRATIRLSRT